MSRDSLTTSTCPFPIVRIVCAKCARGDQYRRQTLIDRFGPDTGMLEVLEELEQCPTTGPERMGSRSDSCRKMPDCCAYARSADRHTAEFIWLRADWSRTNHDHDAAR
jgi:hypothetical protein